MQCTTSCANNSGGGIVERKPSHLGHHSLPTSLGHLGLSNIGLTIPGSNSHSSTPPTSMFYDRSKPFFQRLISDYIKPIAIPNILNPKISTLPKHFSKIEIKILHLYAEKQFIKKCPQFLSRECNNNF